MSSVVTKLKQPEVIRETRQLGWVADPDAFFANEKRRMLDELGDLSGIRIPLNRILLAIWTTKEERRAPTGSTLILTTDIHKDEQKWQGWTALVLKMGPMAYAPNDAIEFSEADRCKVGDWVLFRKGEGMRVEIYKHECILLDSERSIRAVLDRPDAVF